jgi:copper chaperone CopZ
MIRLAVVVLLAGLAVACQPATAADPVPPSRNAPPVASSQSPLQSVRIHVEGMACDKCSARLREGLGKLDGVIAVEADHQKKEVAVRYDTSRVTAARIKHEIQRYGFDVSD